MKNEGRDPDLPGELVRSAPVPLAVLDGRDHRVLHASTAFAALAGRGVEEITGHPFADLFHDPGPLERRLASVDAGEGAAVGVAARPREGDTAPLALTLWRVGAEGRGGEHLAVLATPSIAREGDGSADETLREVNESLLLGALRERERADEARKQSRAKSVFLASISHELRTPLNSIVGSADLMEEGIPEPVPDVHLRNVRRIRASADHLLELIEQIISASRAEVESPPLDDEVDLGAFAREMEDMVEPQVREKGLDCRIRVENGGRTLVTDRRRLTQIVANLMTNAVKFTDQGTVTLEVEGGDPVTIRVEDTGIGIEPSERDRIFERFWQARGSEVRTNDGMGIGLWVTRTLVDALGGEIDLESEPGVGSTFEVRLPRERREED